MTVPPELVDEPRLARQRPTLPLRSWLVRNRRCSWLARRACCSVVSQSRPIRSRIAIGSVRAAGIGPTRASQASRPASTSECALPTGASRSRGEIVGHLYTDLLLSVDDLDVGAVAANSSVATSRTEATVTPASAVPSVTGTRGRATIPRVATVSPGGTPGASCSACSSSALNMDALEIRDDEQQPVTAPSVFSFGAVIYAARGVRTSRSVWAISSVVEPGCTRPVGHAWWCGWLRTRRAIHSIVSLIAVENDRHASALDSSR